MNLCPHRSDQLVQAREQPVRFDERPRKREFGKGGVRLRLLYDFVNRSRAETRHGN